MLVTYVIDNDSGLLNFKIAPGELNGPGGLERHTDLRLYGNGALRWGEGVNENFLRLIESFSCPAKQNVDNWFDGSTYDPEKHRLWPKEEGDESIPDLFDRGPGRGINRPTNGQTWFNTTDRRMYVYDHSKKQDNTVTKWAPDGIGTWVSASGVFYGDRPPSAKPSRGDMWYDTSGIICGQPQLFIYYPEHPEALPSDHKVAPGWVSAAENYVKQCGDYMSGDLDMGGKNENAPQPNSIINVKDIYDPTNSLQPHSQASYALNVRSGDARYVNVAGDHMTGNLDMRTNKIVNIGDINDPGNATIPHPTEAGTALNVRSGDARYINKAGDKITGDLDMNGHFITGLACRSTPKATDALSKACADKLYVNETGDKMTGWLELVRNIPNVKSAAHDYHAVPVKMLRDYVEEKIGPFGKGAIYYAYVSSNFSQTGGLVANFNFDSWRQEYNRSTGQSVTPAQFLVVCIPTFEMFRVSNAKPLLASQPPGTLGDYGWVEYHAGPNGSFYPKSNNLQYISIKAGPSGVDKTGNKRAYSCRGASKVGLHFFGGPLNVLWKKRTAPRG